MHIDSVIYNKERGMLEDSCRLANYRLHPEGCGTHANIRQEIYELCICGSREGAGAKGSIFSKDCLPPNCWQLHSPIDVTVTDVLHGKHRDLTDRPKIGHLLQVALSDFQYISF